MSIRTVDLPQSFLKIAKTLAMRYGDDIDKAASKAEQAIRALPEFEKYRDELIRRAVHELIQTMRDSHNVALKRSNGEYGQAAKFTTDAANRVAANNWFSYCIGQRTLGSITGAELPEIRKNECAKIQGIQFNVSLCDRLIPLVKPLQRVDQAVKYAALAKICNDLRRGV